MPATSGEPGQQVAERGKAEEPIDAERLFPHTTEERGEAGDDGAEKIQHADGRGAGIRRDDFEGGREDVSHEEPAEQAEGRRGNARGDQRVAVAERVQAGRAEEEARAS